MLSIHLKPLGRKLAKASASDALRFSLSGSRACSERGTYEEAAFGTGQNDCVYKQLFEPGAPLAFAARHVPRRRKPASERPSLPELHFPLALAAAGTELLRSKSLPATAPTLRVLQVLLRVLFLLLQTDDRDRSKLCFLDASGASSLGSSEGAAKDCITS